MTQNPFLISPQDLAAVIGRDGVSIVDASWYLPAQNRFAKAEYDAGHVPGAVFFDQDDIVDPASSLPHTLPPADVFAEKVGALGISDTDTIVVYDGMGLFSAPRVWWMFRTFGAKDVRVLDGGWAAWLAGGGAVETGPVDPAPGGFTARPGRMPVVELDGVLDVDVLVDARAPERYRGEAEPMDPVAGRVPGAVNVPTTTNLTSAGTFRDAATLRALYAAEGVEPGADVAAYCGSGVTACHDVLAMEVAGIRAALYPGSWSEWSADPTRPVERG